MILYMIQGCRYLRRSTDRWLLSKNSTTRLEGLEGWHGAGLLWNCSMPITNTKGLYLYLGSNTTPSRPRLQHLLPKINIMTSCPSHIHHQFIPFFISNPRHHAFPNAFHFHPWNSSSAEWRCTPDRRRLYRMLWGKPSAEWCSSAKFGSHVSLFPVPIFDVNSCAHTPLLCSCSVLQLSWASECWLIFLCYGSCTTTLKCKILAKWQGLLL
jgi:hypothetical protein